MAFTRVPGFLPSQSGFHFSNSYPSSTNYPVISLPIVGTIVAGDAGNGLCGGFVLAALDLFCHSPRLSPPNTGTDKPPAGSPIFNYLVARLLDGFGYPNADAPLGNAARVIEWIHTPGHDVTISLFGAGLARRVVQQEWPKIKSDIDSGVPSPLNLVMGPERDLHDISGHIATLHNCHQVLAYAYEVDSAKNLTLLVYDCNDPTNDDSRISLNIGSDPAHTIPISAPAVDAALGGGHTVRAFFRTNYQLDDPSVIAAIQTQSDWRWCNKCQGLFFGGGLANSQCPVGGTHAPPQQSGSGNYSLPHNAPENAQRQSDWRWCNKCQGLFFGGGLANSHCPVGGTHAPPQQSGSGNYSLPHNVADDAQHQSDWRWCNKCQGLFFGGGLANSHCPVGGTHAPPQQSGSGNYSLPHVPQ
jgi:hypothetical protein